ncbi:MAG: CARDB domain-containing protein [Acidobacteriota bacterium]
MRMKLVVIAFLCVAGLVGCAKKTAPAFTNPDLLPVPDPRPGVGFSIVENAHTPNGDLALIVTVKNRGATDAAVTTTTVLFRGAPIDVPTPAIPAGGTTTLAVPIPSICFHPDCGFEIEVDSKHQINETDETNNKGGGLLVG